MKNQGKINSLCKYFGWEENSEQALEIKKLLDQAVREAEAFAYVQGQIDGTKREEIKWIGRGFASAREKAARIVEKHAVNDLASEREFELVLAERIRGMIND